MGFLFNLFPMYSYSYYEKPKSDTVSKPAPEPPTYANAMYYSEWSFPDHNPMDIPLSHITHLYYAFIDIDYVNENIKLKNRDWELLNPVPFETDSLSRDFSDMQKLNSSEYNISAPWIDEYLDQIETYIINKPDTKYKTKGIIGQLHAMRRFNPRLKISMSIGGSESFIPFRIVTSNKERSKQFVSNVVANMIELGFDGVDIDWEFPMSKNDYKNLEKMLKLFHIKFAKLNENKNTNRKLLTIALPVDISSLKKYNFKKIDKYVDFYNFMGYDMSDNWSSVSHFHSNLYSDDNIEDNESIDNSIKYLKEYVKSEKILLGMPTYGRSFDSNGLYREFNNCAEIALSAWKNIDDDYEDECIISYYNLPPENFTEVSDTDIGAAYAYNPTGIIVYDTPEIARLKADYVVQNNLGGGMWWDSKGDTWFDDTSRSLIYNFVEQLGGVYSLTNETSEFNYNGPVRDDIVTTEVGKDDFSINSSTKPSINNFLLVCMFILYLFIY